MNGTTNNNGKSTGLSYSKTMQNFEVLAKNRILVLEKDFAEAKKCVLTFGLFEEMVRTFGQTDLGIFLLSGDKEAFARYSDGHGADAIGEFLAEEGKRNAADPVRLAKVKADAERMQAAWRGDSGEDYEKESGKVPTDDLEGYIESEDTETGFEAEDDYPIPDDDPVDPDLENDCPASDEELDEASKDRMDAREEFMRADLEERGLSEDEIAYAITADQRGLKHTTFEEIRKDLHDLGIYYRVVEKHYKDNPENDYLRLRTIRIEDGEILEMDMWFDKAKKLYQVSTPSGTFLADNLMFTYDCRKSSRIILYFWYAGVHCGHMMVEQHVMVKNRLQLVRLGSILSFLAKKNVPITWGGFEGNPWVIHKKASGETVNLIFRDSYGRGCVLVGATVKKPGFKTADKKPLYIDASSLLSETQINSIPVVFEDEQDWMRTCTEEEIEMFS